MASSEDDVSTPKRPLDEQEDVTTPKRRCVDVDTTMMASHDEEISSPGTLDPALMMMEDPEHNDYSLDFIVYGEGTPLERVTRLSAAVNTTHYLPVRTLEITTTFLRQHVQDTMRAPGAWYSGYMANSEFWTQFFEFLSKLLDTDDPFDPGTARKYGQSALRELLYQFCSNSLVVALRFVNLIEHGPIIAPSDAHSSLLAQLVRTQAPLVATKIVRGSDFMLYAMQNHRLQLKSMESTCFDVATQSESLLRSILRLLSALAASKDETVPTFNCVRGLVSLMPYVLQARLRSARDINHESYQQCLDAFKEFLSTFTNSIFPRALKCTSKTVGNAYHSHIVGGVAATFGSCLPFLRINDVDDIFDHVVDNVSTDGAVDLPHLQHASGIPQSRRDEVLRLLWSLDAHVQMIRSDIMELRTTGVVMLRDELARWLERRPGNSAMLTFACNVLMHRRLPHHIFGPETHATVLKEAKDIMILLARTHIWTKSLTDCIWTAWTNSTHDEYKKIVGDILVCSLPDMHDSWSVDLLEKYHNTTVDRYTFHELRLLHELFAHVQMHKPDVHDKQCQLIAEICFFMLVHIAKARTEPDKARLAYSGIVSVVRSSSDHSLRLYRRCATCIKDQTSEASAAWEVFRLCLQIDGLETRGIRPLQFLSIPDAVAEFSTFVERGTKQQQAHNRRQVMHGLQVRIEVMLQLLDLQNDVRNSKEEEVFWDHAIGKYALDHDARDRFLQLALSLQGGLSHPGALVSKLNQHLASYTTVMSPRSATQGLVRHLGKCIKQELMEADLQKFIDLLNDWQWQQLMHLACNVTDDGVRKVTLNIISDFLFATPAREESPSPAIKLSHFVKQQLSGVKHDLHKDNKSDDTAVDHVAHKMYVLQYVLDQGKQRSASRPRQASTIVLSDDYTDEPTRDFRFKLHGIPGPSNAVMQLVVSLSPNADCRRMYQLLREHTGADSFSIIGGGTTRQLSDLASTRVSELCQQVEPLIKVHFSPLSDLTKLDLVVNEVERALQRHYNELESLLDVLTPTAEAAYSLLRQISPPASALQDLLNSDLGSEVIFKADSPWRCAHYASLLWRHLEDCCKHGLVTETLIRRSIDLFLRLVVQVEYRSLYRCRTIAVQAILWALDGEQGNTTLAFGGDNLKKHVSAILRNPLLPGELELPIYVLGSITHKTASSDSESAEVLADLHTGVYELAYQLLAIEPRWTSAFFNSNVFVEYHEQLVDAPSGACRSVERLLIPLASQLSQEARDSWVMRLANIATTGLGQSSKAAMFFESLAKVYTVGCSQSLGLDGRRSLLATLIKALWSYRHTEHPDVGIQDEVLRGLLKLIDLVVTDMSHSDDRRTLETLATDIFTRLLFPSCIPSSLAHEHDQNRDHVGLGSGTSSPPQTIDVTATGSTAISLFTAPFPLVGQDNRALCLSIVDKVAPTEMMLERMSEHLRTELVQLPIDPFVLRPERIMREPLLPAGLTNLGMTCYMNSLLQQVYGSLQMRRALLNAQVKTLDGQQQLLYVLQDLFAKMQHGKTSWCSTAPLAQYLNVATDVQEDVHSFWTIMLSAIEQAFADAESRKQFTSLYTGQLLSQVRGACGHVSSRTEDFSDISLTVQNKASLSDSLAEFVQGETMRGADCYKCTTCDPSGGGRLVEAIKRTCLKAVPDTVVFCLKRFTFDLSGRESKNNDLFRFPETIDLAPYQLQNIEDDNAEANQDDFRLTGVIVHSGTMSFGHYWSYTLRRESTFLGGPEWYRLEDRKVETVSRFADLENELFGGNGRSHSAYVLFYERQAALDDAILASRLAGHHRPDTSTLPLRVAMPKELMASISECNLAEVRINNIFAKGVQDFLQSRSEHVGLMLDPCTALSDLSDRGIEAAMGQSRQLASLAGVYARRVLLMDSNPTRIETFGEAMLSLMLRKSVFAVHFLHSWVRQEDFFSMAYWYHREQALVTVIKALSVVKDTQPNSYLHLLKLVLTEHEDLTRSGKLDNYYPVWRHYFLFIKNICKLGQDEVAAVLGMSYLRHAIDIVNTIPLRQAQAQQIPHCRSTGVRHELEFNEVFGFLREIVQGCPRRIGSGVHCDLLPKVIHTILETRTQQTDDVLLWLVHGAALDSPVGTNQIVMLVELLMALDDHAIEAVIYVNLMTILRPGRSFTLDTMYGFVKSFCLHASNQENSVQLIKALVTSVVSDQSLPQEELLEMIDAVALFKSEIVMHTATAWLEAWLRPRSRVAEQAASLLTTLLNIDKEAEYAELPLDASTNRACASFCYDVIVVSTSMIRLHSSERELLRNWAFVTVALTEGLLLAQRFDQRVSAVYEECDALGKQPGFDEEFSELHSKLSSACKDGHKALHDIERMRTRVCHIQSDDDEQTSSSDEVEDEEDDEEDEEEEE